MSIQRLTVLAELQPQTGYTDHLIEMVRGLQKLGVYCSIRAFSKSSGFGTGIPLDIAQRIVYGPQPEPWELILAPPHHLPTPGKKTIYFTMWESTRLPARSVKFLNMAEVVIVPCQWCLDNFKASGVTKPIHIVPLGIDPVIFAPRPIRKGLPVVFGAAGRMAHGGERKGLREAIVCFSEAFRGDEKVEMRVKCHLDCNIGDIKDPRITVTKAHLQWPAWANWLADLTCLVSPVTGEGWGLIQQQAAAIGRPVIAPHYGGLREFLHMGNSYPIHYDEQPTFGSYNGCGDWAVPDLGSVIGQMRNVYTSTVADWKEHLCIKSHLAREFTWDRSVRLLANVLGDTVNFNNVADLTDCESGKMVHTNPPVWFNYYLTPDGQAAKAGWDRGIFTLPESTNTVQFNPTICRVRGKLILLVRQAVLTKDGDTSKNRIIRYALNESLQCVSEGVELKLNGNGHDIEDARCFTDGMGGIWVSFGILANGKSHQAFAMLDEEFNVEYVWHPEYGENTTNPKDQKGHEKNWVWFYQDGFNCSYHLDPHTVFKYDGNKVTDQFITQGPQRGWAYGRPSGSTPPLHVGDYFYALFHSHLPWHRARRRYYVGAYKFEAKPPYRIVGITKEPILWGSENDPNKPNRHCCLFPSGAIMDKDEWLVTAGWNDESCLWFRIPHKDIVGLIG